jgi:hypothetical protein
MISISGGFGRLTGTENLLRVSLFCCATRLFLRLIVLINRLIMIENMTPTQMPNSITTVASVVLQL